MEFAHPFQRRASVKDMIESFGVPHPEIELILVNGRSVEFSHIVQDGDRISVYPVFESLDVTPLLRLRPAPLRRRSARARSSASGSIPNSSDKRRSWSCATCRAFPRSPPAASADINRSTYLEL